MEREREREEGGDHHPPPPLPYHPTRPGCLWDMKFYERTDVLLVRAHGNIVVAAIDGVPEAESHR